MTPTYATARAACVERWGAPTHDRRFAPTKHGAAWVHGRSGMGPSKGMALQQDGDTLRLVGSWFPATFARTLAGEPAPDAPAATLPDTLDAADAFLRTHTTATKGP